MLLIIRADIDGAKTAFASFNILGPIPSRPVAFEEFNPFIDWETRSVEIYGTVKIHPLEFRY